MLNIKNLTIALGDQIIVKNLNLSVQPGSVHAIMGPNGSGKSTLAATLMGDPRYTVTNGTAELNGVNILELAPDKRAQAGLFLAYQQPVELPGVRVFTFLKEAYNAVHKVKLDPKAFQEKLLAMMDVLNMDHAYAQRNVNEGFSGGEKKRLELLQLLLLQPQVAILDEIDSGLDIDALKLVAQALSYAREKNPQMIVVAITHYQRLLDHVKPDFVHIVQQGALVQSGTAALAHVLEQKGYDGIRS